VKKRDISRGKNERQKKATAREIKVIKCKPFSLLFLANPIFYAKSFFFAKRRFFGLDCY